MVSRFSDQSFEESQEQAAFGQRLLTSNMSGMGSGNARHANRPNAPGIIKKSFNSILSGVSTLGNMMFGKAEAGTLGFSTPVVNSSLGSITADQFAGMNGPPGTGTTANAVVNSGNTTSNVTTVVSGGGGIKTIDTEMARRMHSYQMIGGIVSGQRAY